MKKKPSYKDAMSHLKRSEDFEERTIKKLGLDPTTKTKGASTMTTTYKATPSRKKWTIWTGGIAACAVLALGIYAFNPGNETAVPTPTPIVDSGSTNQQAGTIADEPPGQMAGKRVVNFEGVIEEVSEDGLSFRVGELWVTVNDATEYGITGPTAPPVSEQLVSDDFKVGNTVAGFTSEDVSSGKVTAERIYNNF